MKKFLLSAFIISGIAYQAHAQLKLGVKAGVNLAKIHAVHKGTTPPGSNVEFKNRVGIVGGVMAQLPVVSNISIQVEALYSSKGAKIEGQDSDNKGPALNYLSIPVLAVYKPSEKFGIEAGLEFGTLLSAKHKIAGKDTDIKDNFESGDLGLVGGLQFQVTENLILDARYIYGLKKISDATYKNSKGNEVGSVKYNNQTIQISLAYMFLQ